MWSEGQPRNGISAEGRAKRVMPASWLPFTPHSAFSLLLVNYPHKKAQNFKDVWLELCPSASSALGRVSHVARSRIEPRRCDLARRVGRGISENGQILTG